MNVIRICPGDPLTPNMRETMIRMIEGNGISYAYDTDRTMQALQRRALVGYSRGGKYGKAHWTLTDSGTDAAKHLRAQTYGLPHALIVSASLYGALSRAGHRMIDYVINKPIPTIDQLVQAEIDRNDGVKS